MKVRLYTQWTQGPRDPILWSWDRGPLGAIYRYGKIQYRPSSSTLCYWV